MGYESKLIVVAKGYYREKVGLYWAEEIASFDLCCVDEDVLKKIKDAGVPTDCYIDYDDDGFPDNADCYGEVMLELSIEDAVKILKYADSHHDYRRYPPCLAMLKSFEQQQPYWNDLVVLHYGH